MKKMKKRFFIVAKLFIIVCIILSLSIAVVAVDHTHAWNAGGNFRETVSHNSNGLCKIQYERLDYCSCGASSWFTYATSPIKCPLPNHIQPSSIPLSFE